MYQMHNSFILQNNTYRRIALFTASSFLKTMYAFKFGLRGLKSLLKKTNPIRYEERNVIKKDNQNCKEVLKSIYKY